MQGGNRQKARRKQGFVDLLWPKVLLVEQKSLAVGLKGAKEQALQYVAALPAQSQPEYILLCDFETFQLYRPDTGWLEFRLEDFHQARNLMQLAFICGHEQSSYHSREVKEKVNIEAAAIMGKFYDSLRHANFKGRPLELYLVRLMYCMFADGMGIFPEDYFGALLHAFKDGDMDSPLKMDSGALINQLFNVLDTAENDRDNGTKERFKGIPYINGGLFRDNIRGPLLTEPMRKVLWNAQAVDWSAISPDIFGALFQEVMSPAERRAEGGHYTSEENILKVLRPLFLKDLETELLRIKEREYETAQFRSLMTFKRKLRSLRFLDPACGCGNFLLIAYREMRRLESRVIKLLMLNRNSRKDETYQDLIHEDTFMPQVNVDQFFRHRN